MDKIDTFQSVITINDDHIIKEYKDHEYNTYSSVKSEVDEINKFNSDHKPDIFDIKEHSYKMRRYKIALGDPNKVYEDNVRRMLFSLSSEELISQIKQIEKDLKASKITHNDINPGNILLDEKTRKLKLIDFYWSNPTKTPLDLNKTYGKDKGAFKKIIKEVNAILENVEKEVTKFRNEFIVKIGEKYNLGSSITRGYSYHPIDIPGMDIIPSHKNACISEYDFISGNMLSPKTTLDIGGATGYFTFNLIRDNFLDRATIYEADPVVNKLLKDIKRVYNLKELEVHETFDETIEEPSDVTIWMNSHMWIHKALGEDKTLKTVKNVIKNSKLLFFQTAGRESEGAYTVDTLDTVDAVKKMLTDCKGKPTFMGTTDMHGGSRHLFKVTPERIAKVTIVIPTKNRYDALAMTLWSLYNQTYKDWDLLILDNSDEREDVRKHHLIGQILDMMLKTGHKWKLLFNNEPGPQTGHQLGLDTAETEYIWRIDDDEMAEPDTLERLYKIISENKKVGAVAPLVLLPNSSKINFVPWTAGKIGWADYCFQNQDCTFDKNVEVEHLHSSFIYRKDVGQEIGGFFQGFSRVGHREETDFSYRIHKAGYKLLVATGARITHLKMPHGGIRSNNPNHELWLADDRMFWERVRNMNPDTIFVPMLCGIGDVISSTSMLQGLQEKNPDKKIIIGTEFPNIIPYTSWNHNIVKKLSNKSATPYIKGGDYHITDAWCKLYDVENNHKLRIVSNGIANKRAEEICKEPTVLIFTESKYPYKHWAKERWDEVIKYLDKKYKVITFPPFNHNLTEVIALLSHCEFFISIDSWAGHAGHAVGKKGIVLWGETDPKHFGYDTNINIEKADHNPDVQWSINKELTNEKMLEIKTDEVINKIKQLEKDL